MSSTPSDITPMHTDPTPPDRQLTGPPRKRRGGHWIDDWRPEDPVFWEKTGAKIAKQNLIFSVLTEHIGFSVWSLWSVIVLFLGPDYGIDPAGKFLLTALPTLVGAVAADPVHLRRRPIRRPELDHHQRAAAADADGPDRDLPRAGCLVHHPADRRRRSPASAAATSPRR